MTQLNQIWKCNVCGNIVTVLHEGTDSLVCCGQPMNLLEAKNSSEDPQEMQKHIPIIEGNKVIIGELEHPIEESHFIEWISATNGKTTARIFLKPSNKPETEFCFKPITTRCYCNVHGLWKNK